MITKRSARRIRRVVRNHQGHLKAIAAAERGDFMLGLTWLAWTGTDMLDFTFRQMEILHEVEKRWHRNRERKKNPAVAIEHEADRLRRHLEGR